MEENADSSPMPAIGYISTSCGDLGVKSLAPDELPNPSPLVSEDKGDKYTDAFIGSGNAESEASDDDYVPSGKVSTSIRGRGHASRSPVSTISHHGIPPDEPQVTDSCNVANRSSTSGDDPLHDHGGTTSQWPPTKSKKLKEPIFLGPDDSLDEPLVVRSRREVMEAKAGLGQGGKYVPDVGEPGAVKKKRRYVASVA